MVFAKIFSFFLLMNLFHNSLQSKEWSIQVTMTVSGDKLDEFEKAKASIPTMLSHKRKYKRTSGGETETMSEEIAKMRELIQTNKLLVCGVGMQHHVTLPATNSNIQNEQITASSWYDQSNAEIHAPWHARLFGSSGVGCWSALTKDENQWIQVDLQRDTTVYGISTQGRQRSFQQWVTTYQVWFKPANVNYFSPIVDKTGLTMVFQGNRDLNTPVTNSFPSEDGITAQIFRIKPLTWNNHISMRFDLITC